MLQVDKGSFVSEKMHSFIQAENWVVEKKTPEPFATL